MHSLLQSVSNAITAISVPSSCLLYYTGLLLLDPPLYDPASTSCALTLPSSALSLSFSEIVPKPQAAFRFFLPLRSPNFSSNFLIATRELMSSEIDALISANALSKCFSVNVRLSGYLYGSLPVCLAATSFSSRTQARAAATERFFRSEPE